MISTYPGSTVLASFSLVDSEDPMRRKPLAFECPDGEPIFIQKLSPDEIMIRNASTGKRMVQMRAVDDSDFSAFFVNLCESSARSSSSHANSLITGHSNGSLQMWDLSLLNSKQQQEDLPVTSLNPGGFTGGEMAKLIDSSNRLQL